jgi:uncharacterized coiled-coil protein SlyX
MSAMGKYDITNDEQLRILTERLDQIAVERTVTNTRLDRMTEEGQQVITEWQTWRKGVEERLSEHTALIAERLRHPLMDPATVEEMRRAQTSIGIHLSEQDAMLAALRVELNERFSPIERITDTMERLTKMLRWVLLAFGGGAFYEVGKVLIDRWLR